MTDPAILGGNLQTLLGGATFVRAGWSAARAATLLAQGQFDQAPVLNRGRLVGYALRKDLEAHPSRRVRGVSRSLDQEIVLSASAQLGALLTTLRDRRFAFIVGENGISGFVTPSDLNKHAARAHFYLLIAALEIKMSDLVRRIGPPETQVLSFLGSASRKLIERRFHEDSRAGIEVDYLVYLLFSQLLNIVGAEPLHLQRLGFESRSQWRRATAGLVRLRNDVMHPTREFYGPQRTIDALIDAEFRLRNLLERFDAVTMRQGVEEAKTEPARVETDAPDPPLLTLHQAMERVLAGSDHPMHPRDLAKAVNLEGLYRRRDGAPVPAGQISARAHRYQHLFTRTAHGLGRRGQQ
jgi:hypothetical protein